MVAIIGTATGAVVLLKGVDMLQHSLKPLINDRLWVTLLIAFAHTLPALAHQAMMLVIQRANLFQELIIQPNPRSPVTAELKHKLWRSVFITHVIVVPFVVWLLHPYIIEGNLRDIPTRFQIGLMPTFKEALPQLFICILFEDAAFYWSHRLLHTPWLYARIHKQHHEFHTLTACSFASEYTHPIESILGNIVPLIIGPLICHCKFTTFLIWIVIRIFKTCDAHCGYAFRWSPFGLCWPLNNAAKHDYHHESGFGGCFGSFFVIWDQICGTDESYYRDKHTKQT